MAARNNRLLLRLVIVIVVALIGAYQARHQGQKPARSDQTTAPAPTSSVEAAWRDHAEGIMLQADGRVQRLLADDREGSPHQRFLVELPSGHTVLVAHNIDLAQRVPVREGDAVTVTGQYEWNAQGGVIHWTHHDPAGRHPGGWIEHAGRRYQ